MAQGLKLLVCKYEDRILEPQHTEKSPSVGAWVFSPVAELGGERQKWQLTK